MSERDKKAGGGAKRAWPLFMGLPLIIAVAIAAVLLSGNGPNSLRKDNHHSPRSNLTVVGERNRRRTALSSGICLWGMPTRQWSWFSMRTWGLPVSVLRQIHQ